MAKVNGSPVAVNPADFAAQLAAQQARIEALMAENAALQARNSKAPGFFPKPVPAAKDPANTGRYLAERVTPGGVVLSYFVGPHGKTTFGSGFGSRPFGLWGGEVAGFCDWAESGGLRQDLTDPRMAAHMAAAWVRGG